MTEEPRDQPPANPFAPPRSDQPTEYGTPGSGTSEYGSGYGASGYGGPAYPSTGGYGPPTSYPDPYATYGTSGTGQTSPYGGYTGAPGYPSPEGMHGQPGPYPPGPYASSAYSYGAPARTNGMAIASLVLGLAQFVMFWFSIVGAILALVFGYIARNQIRERGGQGNGLAVAGIVLGWVGVALVVVVGVVLVIGFAVAGSGSSTY